jgi:uncharacterized protein YrrD
MLQKAKTLNGYRLYSLDGEIGSVKEFYFDDRFWTIRYLVVETGNWLKERQVLISPYALTDIMTNEKHIAVNLKKNQIEDSPSLNSDKPVSRQFEDAYYGYYGWPIYWGGPHEWGSFPYIARDSKMWKETIQNKNAWDPHLRSIHAVTGYHIQATDGEIGHVDDFIIDDRTWAIRYLVIDTRNWWPGNKVLFSPLWIDRISWSESKVYIDHSRDTVKLSPPYTDDFLLSSTYETELYRHYDPKGYWREVSDSPPSSENSA